MLFKRLLFLCAVGFSLVSGQAWAVTCPIEIKNDVTTPQDTAQGGLDCDVTIDSGASVKIKTAGAAVTVNSPNNLTNNGVIENSAVTGAIGVELDGGALGKSFINTGSIIIDGKDATGGIGIDVAGSGFIGDVTLQSTTTLNVQGVNSIAVAINAALQGDLSLSGAISSVGAGAEGVFTTAQINGSITNEGELAVAGTLTASASAANPGGGVALGIGASVANGILNTGPTSATDIISSTGNISDSSALPTIEISPILAGAGATNVLIGIYTDATNPDYSFLNRGDIAANGGDPGVQAEAILIKGDGTNTATLQGGFFNRGIVAATTNTGSDAKGKKLPPAAGNAIVFEVGNGGVLQAGCLTCSAFVNNGSLEAINVGLGGGTATTILIDAGGSLPSLINSGTLSATATETVPNGATGITLSTCVICDNSGTLTSIFNSGTISATTTALAALTGTGNSVTTIAVDLSHCTTCANVTFVNEGTVTGDILFGAGNDVLEVSSESVTTGTGSTAVTTKFIGAVTSNIIDFGAGNNVLQIDSADTTGGASVDANTIEVATGGTLVVNVLNGTLTTASLGAPVTGFAAATQLHVGATGEIVFVLGASAPIGGAVITTIGDATLDAGSKIALGFDGFLNDGVDGQYVLINAGGTLSAPDCTGTSATSTAVCTAVSLPWLFSGDVEIPTADPNKLVLNFALKPAASLGLTHNEAAIYGQPGASPLVEAISHDPEFGGAFLDIQSEAQGKLVLNSLAPDVSGATRAMAIAITDQATGALGARQRTLTEYAADHTDFETWGQEFVNTVADNGSSATAPGYDGHGFGFAMGADGGSPQGGRYGGAFTFFASNVNENEPLHSKTSTEWYMASAYSNWRGHVLFFDTELDGGYGQFSGNRLVTAGSVTRNAKGLWTGYLASGGFSTGFMFKAGSLIIMPEANLDALFLSQTGYSERNGGGGVDLDVGSQQTKSLRSFLGLVLRDNIAFNEGYLQPEIRGGWSHDFLNDPASVTANFVSVPTLPFNITGPNPDASRFIGGFSLSFNYASWSAGLNYDVTDTSGSLAHAGTLTVTGRI